MAPNYEEARHQWRERIRELPVLRTLTRDELDELCSDLAEPTDDDVP